MRSKTIVAVLTVVAVVQVTSATVTAQEQSRGDRYFGYLDRDQDGTISTEEFARMDERMRDRLKEVGIDGKQSLAKDAFLKAATKFEERRDGGERRGPDGRTKPKEKVKLVLELPANYAALDLNKDRQIGLYEWDRSRLADFLKLDRNGDGFLTPKELDDPVRDPSAVVTPPAPQVVATTAPGAPAAVAGKPAPSVKAAPAVASTGTPSDGTKSPATSAPVAESADRDTRRANYLFSITDRNKDGTITQDEWTQSRGVRPMFEKANVVPTFPLTQADFVAKLQALPK